MATRMLVRDERVPKPLRWIAGVALLPIPGPVDEAILLVVASILLIFYRKRLAEAWRATSAESTR